LKGSTRSSLCASRHSLQKLALSASFIIILSESSLCRREAPVEDAHVQECSHDITAEDIFALLLGLAKSCTCRNIRALQQALLRLCYTLFEQIFLWLHQPCRIVLQARAIVQCRIAIIITALTILKKISVHGRHADDIVLIVRLLSDLDRNVHGASDRSLLTIRRLFHLTLPAWCE
jgi:hypothetical protein